MAVWISSFRLWLNTQKIYDVTTRNGSLNGGEGISMTDGLMTDLRLMVWHLYQQLIEPTMRVSDSVRDDQLSSSPSFASFM